MWRKVIVAIARTRRGFNGQRKLNHEKWKKSAFFENHVCKIWSWELIKKKGKKCLFGEVVICGFCLILMWGVSKYAKVKCGLRNFTVGLVVWQDLVLTFELSLCLINKFIWLPKSVQITYNLSLFISILNFTLVILIKTKINIWLIYYFYVILYL